MLKDEGKLLDKNERYLISRQECQGGCFVDL